MKLFINADDRKGRISPEIYGHFSEHLGRCIYEGLYVGESSKIDNVNGMRRDVVDALREVKLPVLRWPGGCFADEYHWRDGIGDKSKRKRMVNTHWGGVVEDNSFGTDEFMELCRQLGCKTYINGNVGSGTVQEMNEWVEYMTFAGESPMSRLRAENGHEEPYRVDYFGVGNENWGCGGNMTPEYYANEYRRYQTYVRNYDRSRPVFKIACGPNSEDYGWTRTVLKTLFANAPKDAHGFTDGLSLHYYTVPGDWSGKGSATMFDEKEYYTTLKKTLRMDELIRGHGCIMDEYDPDKRIALIVDEWGCWYDVEPGTNPGFLYQQNTMRDAVVAGINLNIFNSHCDRVRMANLAQLVNVLQSLILTEGERMVLTPTYHVFNMYKAHQGAELVYSSMDGGSAGIGELSVPQVSQSVSVDGSGAVNITLVNLSLEDSASLDIELAGKRISGAEGMVLTGIMTAHNTFGEPETVKPVKLDCTAGDDGKLSVRLPGCSVSHITLKAE